MKLCVCGYPAEDKMKLDGYPQVEMKQDVKDFSSLLNLEEHLIVYSQIQTTKGQSGSPIFLETYLDKYSQVPEYQLIGVHTGSNLNENFGTYFESFSYENLKKIFCPDDNES